MSKYLMPQDAEIALARSAAPASISDRTTIKVLTNSGYEVARPGGKWLIAAGMIVQAGGIWLTVQLTKYEAWMIGALLQGIGTAMVYPTLLAAISDVAHPEWRSSVMGVYRFWRDLGYAIGALISGVIADLLGMRAAIQVVAILTLLSGLQVVWRMRETLPRKDSPIG